MIVVIIILVLVMVVARITGAAPVGGGGCGGGGTKSKIFTILKFQKRFKKLDKKKIDLKSQNLFLLFFIFATVTC